MYFLSMYRFRWYC